MCAWPIADSSWTREPLRCASSGVRIARACVPGRAVVLDPDVAEAVELGQQLAGPGLVQAIVSVGLQPAQDVEVVMQLPRLAVEARDLAAVEHHRLERAVRRLEPAELAVAGQLDPQIQPFAAGRRIDQQRIDPGTVRAAVESLERAPVHPQRRLAVADPQQVDAFACPLGGHVRRYPKPVGGPQRAEPVAEIRVAVGQCVGLVRRDAVHRPSNLSISGSRASAQISE